MVKCTVFDKSPFSIYAYILVYSNANDNIGIINYNIMPCIVGFYKFEET